MATLKNNIQLDCPKRSSINGIDRNKVITYELRHSPLSGNSFSALYNSTVVGVDILWGDSLGGVCCGANTGLPSGDNLPQRLGPIERWNI